MPGREIPKGRHRFPRVDQRAFDLGTRPFGADAREVLAWPDVAFLADLVAGQTARVATRISPASYSAWGEAPGGRLTLNGAHGLSFLPSSISSVASVGAQRS